MKRLRVLIDKPWASLTAKRIISDSLSAASLIEKNPVAILQWLVVIVLSAFVLVQPHVGSPWTALLIAIGILVANATILHGLRLSSRPMTLVTVLILFDTCLAPSVLYMTGTRGADVYVVYFGIILLASVSCNLQRALAFTLIIFVAYAAFVFVSEVEQVPWEMLILRWPFFFAVTLMYGAIAERVHRLHQEKEQLELSAAIDDLTGLPNRRAFMHRLTLALKEARAQGQALSCAMMDIDGFKTINDSHGHDVGDRLLQRVASVLNSQVRGEMFLGRLGGDEFAWILPQLAEDAGQAVMKEVLNAFEGLRAENGAHGHSITLSIGLATYSPDPSIPANPTLLLKLADMALYMAKRRGGNQICSFPVPSLTGTAFHDSMHESSTLGDRSDGQIRLYEIAFCDIQTGLPNRHLFLELARRALGRAKRHHGKVGLLLCGFDNLKLIAESYGQALGEWVVKEVAMRLIKLGRKTDTLARWSDDVFAILLEDISGHEGILKFSQRASSMFSDPISANGQDVLANISLGAALFPSDAQDAEDLIRAANTAMSAARRDKDRVRFYSPQLQLRAVHRLGLEGELHLALQRNELRVLYQPIVSVRTGHVQRLEALIRWHHPSRGVLGPGCFLDIAEETGLIVPLGEWVLHQACRQLQKWRESGLRTLSIAVNLSQHQLRIPGLVQTIEQVLRDTSLPPGCLDLELTESHLIQEIHGARGLLQALHGIGLQISLDDFGTGYSSLSILQQFPVTSVKIDKGFVSELCQSAKDRSIVQSIIELAHTLGLKVVAEGIETKEQLDFLVERGCDELQGYYFAEPTAPEEIIPVFSQQLLPLPQERPV